MENSPSKHLTPNKSLPKDNDNLIDESSIFQNESDTIDNIQESEIPPASSWHFILSPKIPVWRFDNQKIIRINLSREKFFPYYFCHILITIVYFYYYSVLTKYYLPDNTMFYMITISFILTNLCYVMAHFTNPGLLPWSWAATKQRFYTKDELRSGIAITHDQKEWGKNHDWPARSFFSGDFGAIILRAEHFCRWINQWVGLRNLKFYLQSLFYSIIFSFEYLFILYKVYINSNRKEIKKSFFFIFSGIATVYFLYHFLIGFCVTFYRSSKNYTFVESLFYFDVTFYNKGLIKNLEEVFGSIYLFPLWFLPILIPLPKDGFDYQYRPNSVALAKNRDDDYKDHKR